MGNRIFVERTRSAGVPCHNKKRIIDFQEVSPKRSARHPLGAARSGSLRAVGNLEPKWGGRKARSARRRPRTPYDAESHAQQTGPAIAFSPFSWGVASQGGTARFIDNNQKMLLWISFLLIFGAFCIPVYINIQSAFRERRRGVERDGETLYTLFHDEGIGVGGTSVGGAESGVPVPLRGVPTLAVSTYTVRQGDSLFGIAGRHGISVDGILSANRMQNPRYLKVGTELRVPNRSGVFYRVKGGDSLSGIAHRYRVSVDAIADVNDLASEIIRPGQELFLPGASLSEWERAAALETLFKRPARGRITSKVGFRIDPFTGKMAYHAGVDFANDIGTSVRAAQYGRVSFAGYNGNYGRTVILVHPDGYTTLYAHLSKIFVKRGQAVRQDEKIGAIGNTGRSTGSHLHVEVHRNGKVIDPMKVIKLR